MTCLSSSYEDDFIENVFVDAFVPTDSFEDLKAQTIAEVSKWKNFPRIPKDTNITCLKWWKNNEKLFPIIAKFARRVLCIPASSAASERVFSSSGNTVSDKRNRLSPDVVRHLIFLKDAIKKVSAHKSSCV